MVYLRRLQGPILLHVLTSKGKGYKPAEQDPITFHGTGPFDVPTGSPLNTEVAAPSYTRVFASTLLKMARDDKRIVAITAGMPGGTGLDAFSREFPQRFFDVGIAEAHGVTFCAGMAVTGQRPVAAIYSSFLQRAYDQIIHDVALQHLPVIFCLDRAGLVGEDGPTHHGTFDLSYLGLLSFESS